MTRARRTAPPHVRRAWDAWNLDTIAWEASRKAAANGHATEQAEHDAVNPAPQFRDYLADVCAELRRDRDLQDAA